MKPLRHISERWEKKKKMHGRGGKTTLQHGGSICKYNLFAKIPCQRPYKIPPLPALTLFFSRPLMFQMEQPSSAPSTTHTKTCCRHDTLFMTIIIDTQTDLPPGKQGAQLAFENSMTHVLLQFALRIAFSCVLHRCGSLDIPRHEF